MMSSHASRAWWEHCDALRCRGANFDQTAHTSADRGMLQDAIRCIQGLIYAVKRAQGSGHHTYDTDDSSGKVCLEIDY